MEENKNPLQVALTTSKDRDCKGIGVDFKKTINQQRIKNDLSPLLDQSAECLLVKSDDIR